MSKPSKYASKLRGGLLPIDETIHRRLSVNIELEYWIKTIWPFANHEDEIENRRSLLAPVRMRRIMNTPGLNVMELNNRMKVVTSDQYPIEHMKIKKIVGEFY